MKREFEAGQLYQFEPVNRTAPDVEAIIGSGSVVVDCGCYGWRLAQRCHSVGAQLIGVDRSVPTDIPPGARFALLSDGAICLDDATADVVVASHILEHMVEPVGFLCELLRVTRPGGLIWIEAPSEMSAMAVGTDDPEDHSFQSFWDDPTHVRPWSPGAMYRLALSCRCIPLAISRCDAGGIPAVRMLCRRPTNRVDPTETRYVSLRGVESGVANAWNHVWGVG